jgi:hypothetical protein
MKQFFAHDDFAFGLDAIGQVLDMYSPLKSSFTFRGQLVDTELYDIVPKRGYTEKKIKEKEEELERLKTSQKLTNERFAIEKQNLNNDIEELKRKLT